MTKRARIALSLLAALAIAQAVDAENTAQPKRVVYFETWRVGITEDVVQAVGNEDGLPVYFPVEVYVITAQDEGCQTWAVVTPRQPYSFQLVGPHLAVVMSNGLVYQLGSCRMLDNSTIFADGFESGTTNAWKAAK